MSLLYKSYFPIFFSLFVGIGLQSCTKTVYEYEKSPNNDILQFVVLGGNGDSVKCLIAGDRITINWNPDVELPSTIEPAIVVDEEATISPASGQAVPLSENTTYTVTAANGETKTYRLKIALNIPIPSISSATTPLTWLLHSQINIFGEHFLVNATEQAPDVYLQRIADGFEIPLTLVESSVSNYSMVANLPAFSAEQDTGLHRLYIKYNDRITQTTDIQLLTPPISHANPVSSLVQDGHDVHSGDNLTVNYAFSDSYGGKVASYYHPDNIDYILLYFSPSYETIAIADNISVTANTVTFQLPDIDKYIGQAIVQYRFIYKTVPPASATSSAYFMRGFLAKEALVKAK